GRHGGSVPAAHPAALAGPPRSAPIEDARHSICAGCRPCRGSAVPAAPRPLTGRSTVAELTFALPELDGLEADALIVGTFSTPDGVRLAAGGDAADAALDGRLLAALTAVGATGNEDDVVKLAATGSSPVPVVVATGLGPAPDDGQAPAPQAVARAAGAAVRALGGKARVACTLGLAGGDGAVAELAAAAGEGALLGAYAFGAYRSGDGAKTAPPGLVTVLVPDPEAEELAAAGREVEVLDEDALAAAGFGGVLGVGSGSQRPPRLVRIRHAGTGPRVALVGKGITFDSGG